MVSAFSIVSISISRLIVFGLNFAMMKSMEWRLRFRELIHEHGWFTDLSIDTDFGDLRFQSANENCAVIAFLLFDDGR